MSAVTRNDYGSNAIVDYSKPTVKRIMFQNSPHSVEATGHDKRPENLIEITSANLDALVVGTRVLFGNKQGVVKTVNLTVGVAPLISIVVEFFSPVEGFKEITYTKAELLVTENMFFVYP